MPLVTVARDRIAGLISGAQTCTWGSSNVTIWVASSTAAHAGASTWLGSVGIGSTIETGYPITNANILQYRSVYSTAQANFQWESWLINSASASSSGLPLQIAAQQVLGTKTSAQSWQLTACITITT